METMTPAELQYQQEHIHEDRGSEVVGAVITVAILATVAVTLRFMSRKHMKVAISWDDYLMIPALVLALGLCFIDGYGVRFGTGRHLLAVGLQNVQVFLKLEYAFQIIYAFTLTLVRLSILMFYRRLFPKESMSRIWKTCYYLIVFLVVGFFISGTTSLVFVCTPIHFFWTMAGDGHCINFQLLLYFGASLTIICDLAVLLLPMPIVWNLQMKRSKRIGVMGIFLLGGFVCVASIVRMFYVHQVVPVNPTWTQVDPAIWSTVEPCIGIVSACLPIIGPACRRRSGSTRTKSWRSWTKRSTQSSSYVTNSGDRHTVPGSLQKKPAATATVYSRDTQSDEEMALPLRDVEPRR
ncbi:MAG: hypothetical protein Q9216_000171 [Gyalolechia sp. 2 TL-2023]